MNVKPVVQGIISVSAIVGISYGRLVSVPDAVSRLYGLPLNWGVHQLVTIAGPVDIWNVNISNLVIDLAFWFLVLFITRILLDYRMINIVGK